MHLKFVADRTLFICLALSLCDVSGHADSGTRPADSKTAIITETWSVPGILGGGIKTNDAYTDGSFFLTVPAYSSIGRDGWLSGDVLFIEPYTSWGEQGEVAVSLGLGWRHLFSQQGIGVVLHHDGHQADLFEEGGFIGVNFFVDMLDTQFDNRFWQLGFGIEAGTRYLEARANYYLPLSDRQLAEEIRTQESVTTRSIVPTYHEPFATGHTIQQDVTLSTLATTTTIERLFRRYEDGMEGWDAELALLLPWVDRWMDVKVIGGYYAFDNQPFGPQAGGTGNVEGWKAGLEVRPVPAVVLNATWYEDERLTGGDWIAGVRLELPFEAGDLGDGKSFWDRIGDAFRPRRRHLAERMTEPVRRQNAAVKVSSSVEEDRSAAQVTVATKVVSQSKSRIVLAETVVFVDNAIGDPANPGTYELPVDNIENGKTLGNTTFGNNAIVVVQGRPQAYTESVTITQGVRLFGSGGFEGLGGVVFKGRTDLMPTVSGGFFAQNVPGTVQVTGFDIRDGLSGTPASSTGIPSVGSGVFFENVSHAIISRNTIRPQPPVTLTAGIWAETNVGSGRLQIFDNVVTGGGVGIYADVSGSATMNAEIHGNQVSGSQSGAGITVSLRDSASGVFTLADNEVFKTTGGMYLVTNGASSAVFTVINNLIEGNIMGGMSLLAYDSSTASFGVSSNVVRQNQDFGIFVMAADPGARANAFLSGNEVIFNRGDQIIGRELGTLNFISTGALSNDVREAPGNPGNLYNSISNTENGFIRINGFLHPAVLDLP